MANAEVLNSEANQLYMSGDKKAALDKYSQAIGVDPKVAKYHSNRAQVLLDLEKFQRAANDADRAAELDKSNLKHLFRSGQAYFGLGDFRTAMLRGQAMLKLDPKCPNAAAIISNCEKEMAKRIDPTSPQGIRLAGERFLAEKDGQVGVYRLSSGLRFSLLKRPKNDTVARSPLPADKCSVHYHGQLIDGTVFDSSVERNEPAQFAPNEVIPGWTEALQLMAEGEKWRVFLPYQLGYGAQGAGGDIPPYSVLVFTIELLAVAGGGGKPGRDGHAILETQLGKPYAELLVSEE
jgi:FKBP-type peptidyl-prolyl cis-trans isomerase